MTVFMTVFIISIITGNLFYQVVNGRFRFPASHVKSTAALLGCGIFLIILIRLITEKIIIIDKIMLRNSPT